MPSPDRIGFAFARFPAVRADIQLLCPALEREPVRPARFELPGATELATQDAARLLSEALRLSLATRRRAVPFGSAAWLSSRAPISLFRC